MCQAHRRSSEAPRYNWTLDLTHKHLTAHRNTALDGFISNTTIKTGGAILLLAVLFTAASVYESFHLSALASTDVWLPLRTGTWILQNHQVPHAGLFSQYSDSPWRAYSWGFDVLVASAYKVLGLAALPILLMIYRAGLAVVLFWLACGWRGNFWPAVLLSAVAQYALISMPLQSLIGSVLLLSAELGILLFARESGDFRKLYWLPVLFAVWANLDVHVFFGLMVLIIFLGAELLEDLCRRLGVQSFQHGGQILTWTKTLTIVAGCVAATLLSLYGFHIYEAIPTLFRNGALLPYIGELRSSGFRQPQDFVILLLAMAAFFSLGRLHGRDLFKLLLMIFAAVVSFSVQRESWVVVVASVGVIGHIFRAERTAPSSQHGIGPWRMVGLPTVGMVIAVLVTVAAVRIPRSHEALLAYVGQGLPVKACQYIREHKLPEPLFNNYDWGGFLAWYLPEYPVAIDTRNDLYGDEVTLRYFKIARGELPLSEELHFAYAGTVIVPKNSPLAVPLRAGPRFTPVYEDNVALVAVRTALLEQK